MMGKTEKRQPYDVIVVGSGIAGLYAAIKASQFGRVCLVTKGRLQDTNTWLAQGGIAAALGDDDSPQEHLQDTLAAGAGACVPEAVAVLVENGPAVVRELMELGTPFDFEGSRPAMTREGAHHRNRVLHCGGDATGRLIQETLQARLTASPAVDLREKVFVTDLLVCEGRVCGVKTLHGEILLANAVILATGGLGQVFYRTTNPAVATGDGVAMAFRAGAQVADMEFIQFHPTVFQGANEADTFLISEAVRGEGALLRNEAGERFMDDYHPLAELGPRDVVARAILDQMMKQGGSPVFLDTTHKSRTFLQERFPTIYRKAKERGFDMATDCLPVSPAAHYAMGGVWTGLDGETTLPGLYACGETACSGVHGANRLASNSLLEGLVFAVRAVAAVSCRQAAASCACRVTGRPEPAAAASVQWAAVRQDIRHRMFADAGLLRRCDGLKALQAALENISSALPADPLSLEGWETKNILAVAQLITASALARHESRGGHHRLDCPQTEKEFRRIWLGPLQKEVVNHAPIAV